MTATTSSTIIIGVDTHKAKPQPKVTTAIARELVGYAWDIARRASPAVAG